MRRPGWLAAVLPLLMVLGALLAGARVPGRGWVVRSAVPREAFAAHRCTWYCHNHGCGHAAWLPEALSGDRGLFGLTVRGLHEVGALVMPRNPAAGYGLVNLLLFCVLWPGAIYALWGIALRQRRELRALKRARGG